MILNKKNNQRLGFERFGKNALGREEFREDRKVKLKRQIKEVTVNEIKNKILSTGKIRKVFSVIGSGKEATVLLAENLEGELVCVKVFRYFTSTIKERLRGSIHIQPDVMAALAAKQEYWNLYEIYSHNISVPKPKMLIDNIIIMEFVAEEKGGFIPAPLLREVDLNYYDVEEIFYDSIDILAKLFIKAHYIHGDYSEHNLMLTQKGILYTMDVSQSVQYNCKTFINTPLRIRIDRALKLLEIDIRIIEKFFRRFYRITVDSDEIKDSITKELPQKLQNFLFEKTLEIYPSDMYSPNVFIGKEKHRDEKVYKRIGKTRQKPKR